MLGFLLIQLQCGTERTRLGCYRVLLGFQTAVSLNFIPNFDGQKLEFVLRPFSASRARSSKEENKTKLNSGIFFFIAIFFLFFLSFFNGRTQLVSVPASIN